MAGEIETLKRIKEAEEEAAKRISEAEEKAKKDIDSANAYRDNRILDAEKLWKGNYEKAVNDATAKASAEARKIVNDAKTKAKGIKHLDQGKALEVFEEEVLKEFGV
ncbi:MAG: hypothetical protein QXW10_03155 [Candidatus Micrarchaeaceae archaeon]